MKILVPIKQVPETSNVKMDPETGTMVREGVEAIVNPLDLYAIETALQLREKHGGTITALSMGPPKAHLALREAVAMGCDDAVLLSHKGFAGSDTWATAYSLALAIKKLGRPDLILCGERATDGDTGQVPLGLAAALDLPAATFVSHVESCDDGNIVVRRLVEEGYERLGLPLPALMTVVKQISDPRLPTLRGKQRARKMDLPTWGPDDIGADTSLIGLRGSPTRVVKIFRPTLSRKGRILQPKDDDALRNTVDELIQFLKEKRLVE